MDDLKIFEFGADAAALRGAHESGELPESWEAVFRTLVSEISSMVERRPTSIYLCSADEHTEARNHFGFVLARLLRERIRGTLLVDCDFLSVGLSGIVPHRDALGFLDLLLYGTSLGVITQQAAHGAKVVGAGSFAVTKKSPFAADTFGAARRYLVNQSGCVLFVGPLLDDEGNRHPIAELVDLAVLVRVGERFDTEAPDPLERRIASTAGVAAWSVRLNTRTDAGAERRGAGAEAPTLVAEVEDVIEGLKPEKRTLRPEGDERRVAATPPPAVGPARTPERAIFEDESEISEPRIGRARTPGSRAVRVIASIAAIVAVVFVVWWLFLTRSVRERGEGPEAPPARIAVESSAGDSIRAGGAAGEAGSAEREAAGTTGETAASPDTTAVTRAAEPTVPRGDESVSRGDAAVSRSDSLVFVRELDDLAGQYVIHVSSFRGVDRATNEALYLLGWGYPVFIYHVDLGSKGMWYRVYVGPYASREDAMQVKIKLDGNPRITSTRVSKVPG
jgi:cell division septation protein DedD